MKPQDRQRAALQSISEELSDLIESMIGLRGTIEGFLNDEWLPPVVTIPDSAFRKAKQGICLLCGKKIASGRTIRGLHQKCYTSVRRHVRDKLLSENDLMAAGKMLPKESGGRKPNAEAEALLDSLRKKAETLTKTAVETAKAESKKAGRRKTKKQKRGKPNE